ncbi:glycerol kinase [Ligilactobacillus sp. WILCCON 0076]|uniref:ATP:glycerol 3-phosphotransferase n=1 Tax=Ligilactobacillus ubinensis TaxID=2876789 RepID=A0A9X2FKU8_9LACO|nr:FGGY family carbohydrate kinase [Ligilactobacillus ubinensis]MCP0887049.1 glycerol kinase [Ligilactobacillus ubinensis]
MKSYTLAIDQSTQGTKIILLDSNNCPVYKAIKKHTQIVNKQGWISHNLVEIQTNIHDLVQDLLKKYPDVNLKNIALTNQRETAAAWQKSTGKPLCHAIVWQCNRAKTIIAKLDSPDLKKYVKKTSGLELSPYFSAAKFAWFLQNETAVKKAMQQQDLCLGTIDSWLLFTLTSGKSFKTEPSNACRTQLMNIAQLTWDTKLCSYFKIPRFALAEITDSNSLFGETDFWGLLSHKVPITSILGDSQAALFAQNCFTKGSFKVTFGTGSSVMLNIGDKLPNVLDDKLNTSIAWKRSGKVNYVVEGNINYAGAIISWLQNELQIINSASDTEQLAFSANKDDKTVLIPAFSGLGAPYWKPNLKAAFVGMSRTTTKKEIVRAALNSIAFQINDILHEFKKICPQLESEIHVDGGMVNNRYLMQFLSDISNRKIDISAISELSALGTTLNSSSQLPVCQTYTSTYVPCMSQIERTNIINNWNYWISSFSKNFNS